MPLVENDATMTIMPGPRGHSCNVVRHSQYANIKRLLDEVSPAMIQIIAIYDPL